MDDFDPRAPLDMPVWFRPLLDPTWILPAERAGAQRICFAAEVDPEADNALTLGLPLYLAEAIRMTTDAVTTSFTRGFEAGADEGVASQGWLGLTRVSSAATGLTLGVKIQDASGAPVVAVERTGLDPAATGAVLAELPRLLAQELRNSGVSGVWAPIYVPPTPTLALSSVLAQHLCLVLRDPNTHPSPDGPPDEQLRRRSAAKGVLTALGDLATRSSQLFPSLLFFGGVAATREAKNDVYQGLRQTIAAVTMRATNPADPLNRISVLLFRIFDENGTADSRERAALMAGDEALKQWLLRVRALRWER
ncbi:MAG: hypothetical protein QOI81_1407 [Actinomycetota bacterium]|nr:hypothetical protein [Actinomycetota bacterium]